MGFQSDLTYLILSFMLVCPNKVNPSLELFGIKLPKSFIVLNSIIRLEIQIRRILPFQYPFIQSKNPDAKLICQMNTFHIIS
jgi:hypothetical protein